MAHGPTPATDNSIMQCPGKDAYLEISEHEYSANQNVKFLHHLVAEKIHANILVYEISREWGTVKKMCGALKKVIVLKTTLYSTLHPIKYCK